MPNWCYNRLSAYGDKEEIARLKKFVQADDIDKPEPFDFQKIVPMPQDMIEKIEADSSYQDWYPWRMENWGVKWNCGDVQTDGTETQVDFMFDTAWTYPHEVYKKLSELFPTLDFELYVEEQGVGFYGNVFYKDGSVIDEIKDGWPDEEGGDE